MRRQAGQRRIRHLKNVVGLIIKLLGNFFRVGLVTLKQTLPHRINTTPKRRNPSHAGDCQTHASNFCITREAFVPPKPKEFERTVRKDAGRDSFATMLRSASSSGARKLMFGGRNWCRSARRQTMASIAPAAPNE